MALDPGKAEELSTALRVLEELAAYYSRYPGDLPRDQERLRYLRIWNCRNELRAIRQELNDRP